MKTELKIIKIRDLVEGYKDNGDEGVVGYGGKLNIRPPYQREFVYNDKQRDAVINTVMRGLPLNIMYWVKHPDGTFDIMDGQQRTISIGKYVAGEFSINHKYFHNLTLTEQEEILNYELWVHFCTGTDKEILDWFQIVNVGGVPLNDQEKLNALYVGPFLSDAKIKFCKQNCVGYKKAQFNYEKGTLIKADLIRQELLQTALDWASDGNIQDYMAKHQHDSDAEHLLESFYRVIDWIRKIFPVERIEMSNVKWRELYHQYKDGDYDPIYFEKQIQRLIENDNVTKHSGIYSYLFSGEERELNIRRFPPHIKRKIYEKQKGICEGCKTHFKFSQMQADHIEPWSKGGSTKLDNCRMLCENCNNKKGACNHGE